MSVEKCAEKIRRADLRAYIRRAMWQSLDEKITLVYENHLAKKATLDVFGGLYMRKACDEKPIRGANLISSQHTNSIHIFTGRRLLGVSLITEDKSGLLIASEGHAQLWYAQSPTGDVLALVAPYNSDAGEIEEKEIIIGRYSKPSSITCATVNRHFNIFFNYCSSTSQHRASNLGPYLYRKWLMMRDFRHRSVLRSEAINLAERIVILLFSGTAIWATLYVGGKL